MTNRTYIGRWSSEKAKRRFRALEDEVAAERPGTRLRESIDVATSFGPTRAYRWRGEGEPIVLLHGVSGTGLMWTPYADQLVDRDVYAIDIMGDVGRSEQTTPFATADDFGAWLDEALAGLGVEHARVVGLSLGGFVALSLAVHRPARVASLVLFDPVGVVDLQMLKFLLWGLPVLFGSLAPTVVRRWIARRFRMPLLEQKKVMRLGLYGQLHHPPRFPPFKLFSDDQLRSITVPVSLVVGEHTEMLDSPAMLRRIAALVPDARTAIAQGAGHALTVSNFEQCVAEVARLTPPSPLSG